MIELVRKPTIEDVEYIIENIRDEDVAEIDALCGSTVREALNDTQDLLNVALVWEVNGEVVCIFGATPIKEDKTVGMVWLLATSNFNKYTKRFAVRCKKVFIDVIEKYDYVFNYIHSENVESIKWLEWLGFTIGEPEPLGREGANFNRFEMMNV